LWDCTVVAVLKSRKGGHFEVFGEWLVHCDRLVGPVKEGTEDIWWILECQDYTRLW